jgi:hypothetical protein
MQSGQYVVPISRGKSWHWGRIAAGIGVVIIVVGVAIWVGFYQVNQYNTQLPELTIQPDTKIPNYYVVLGTKEERLC